VAAGATDAAGTAWPRCATAASWSCPSWSSSSEGEEEEAD
jgi:hypothetical protein